MGASPIMCIVTDVDLDYLRIDFLRHVCGDAILELRSLRPKKRTQSLDVAEVEGTHDVFAYAGICAHRPR